MEKNKLNVRINCGNCYVQKTKISGTNLVKSFRKLLKETSSITIASLKTLKIETDMEKQSLAKDFGIQKKIPTSNWFANGH